MNMKKTFYAFLCASIIATIAPTITFADTYLPKSVSIGDSISHDAGETVHVTITDSTRLTGLQKNIEYGVAKTVDIDGLTYFEIITTEYVDISKLTSKLDMSVVIPNILATDATSTYVVYAKYFEKNAPENESFYFTKNFSIVPNNNPFVSIGNINLLQSNGARFDTLHGPTIYSPEDAAQGTKLATSSSIEVTFESNQDTTIVPRISFSKIRSGTFTKDISLAPIAIKKGKTYAVLPLPTFEYEPGVYMGQLSFTSTLLKNKVDFQYIVAGDAVSVGTVSVATQDAIDSFKFEIFGRAIDLDRISDASSTTAATTTPDMYTVKVDFMDSKDMVAYSTTQEVDFSKTDFSVQIPQNISSVSKLSVSVSSQTTKKIVYAAIKDVMYENVSKKSISMQTYAYIVIYILLILLGIIALAKQYVKTAIFCILVLIGLFVSQKSFASLVSIAPYKTSGGSTYFSAQDIGMVPSIFLQDDVANTIYTCGEEIPFVFKAYYLRCTNGVPTIKVGFSWDTYVTPNSAIASAVSSNTFVGSYGSHDFYRSYSSFISKTLTPPVSNPDSLYVSLSHWAGDTVTTGKVRYAIPVKTTCTPADMVCSCSGRTQVCYQNGTAVSSTTNATSCMLKASCNVTISKTKATFTTIVTNALGKLSYKDTDSGKAITNVTTKTITGSSTITQNITVTDAFDKTSALTTCSTDPALQPIQNNSQTGGTPSITSFQATTPVVRKNSNCVYNWNVENVDQCSLQVNNTSVLLQGDGTQGPISVSTANGLNQRAVITCVANGTPASGTIPAVPPTTLSTSTLCQVLPEVIER
jgi:hypothetical protein